MAAPSRPASLLTHSSSQQLHEPPGLDHLRYLSPMRHTLKFLPFISNRRVDTSSLVLLLQSVYTRGVHVGSAVSGKDKNSAPCQAEVRRSWWEKSWKPRSAKYIFLDMGCRLLHCSSCKQNREHAELRSCLWQLLLLILCFGQEVGERLFCTLTIDRCIACSSRKFVRPSHYVASQR